MFADSFPSQLRAAEKSGVLPAFLTRHFSSEGGTFGLLAQEVSELLERDEDAVDGLSEIEEIGLRGGLFESGGGRDGPDFQSCGEGGGRADTEDWAGKTGFAKSEAEGAADEADADDSDGVHAAKPGPISNGPAGYQPAPHGSS